jgi:hypothetical protein
MSLAIAIGLVIGLAAGRNLLAARHRFGDALHHS